MATHPKPDDNHIPYLDQLDPPIADDAKLPPITADDIAHAVERLEAGRESGEYTHMRESDLVVIANVPDEQWEEVKRNPSLLPRLVTPTAHA